MVAGIVPSESAEVGGFHPMTSPCGPWGSEGWASPDPVDHGGSAPKPPGGVAGPSLKDHGLAGQGRGKGSPAAPASRLEPLTAAPPCEGNAGYREKALECSAKTGTTPQVDPWVGCRVWRVAINGPDERRR